MHCHSINRKKDAFFAQFLLSFFLSSIKAQKKLSQFNLKMEFTLSFLLRRITAQNESLRLIPSPKRIASNTQLYSLQPLHLDFTDIHLVLIFLCLASSHESLSVFAMDLGETWISQDKLRPCSRQYREKIPCTPRVLQLRATRKYQTGAWANCSAKLCFQIPSASINDTILGST